MANREEIFARMFALGKLLRLRLEQEGLLPLGQLETLRFIASDEAPTMRELARYHRITAPSATAHVDELVGLRLVRRISDKADRRAVRLQMTAQGGQALRRNLAKRKRIIERLFEPLSEHDRGAFNTILGKILQESRL